MNFSSPSWHQALGLLDVPPLWPPPPPPTAPGPHTPHPGPGAATGGWRSPVSENQQEINEEEWQDFISLQRT